MKFFLQSGIILFFLLPAVLQSQNKKWIVNSGNVTFKSETDLESIWGEGKTVSGNLDLTTKIIKIEIPLSDIKTDNKLQTSHLHENYLETQKFPIASFNGIVSEIKETGEVTARGTLELHGVKLDNVLLVGTIKQNEKGLELLSYFPIRLSDYQIVIPKLLFLKLNQNIQLKVKIQWTKE